MSKLYVLPESENLKNLQQFFQVHQGSFQEPKPLQEIRHKAFQEFSQLGFPSTGHEEWKYTNVAFLAKTPLALMNPAKDSGIQKENLKPFRWNKNTSAFLVFVNGFYDESLSDVSRLSRQVKVGNLRAFMDPLKACDPAVFFRHFAQHAAFEKETFISMNTSFLRDGAFVHIPKGVVLRDPIEILFLQKEIFSGESANVMKMAHPRVLLLAEENSQACVLETFASLDPESVYANIPVSEVVLQEGAVLDHVKIQLESEAAYHIANMQVIQNSSSRFTSHAFSFGGKLVRNNIHCRLDGKGGECVLNGLYLAGNQQHIDNHTLIDHAQPHCNSHELYKGILGGSSRGVFNGKIIVRPDAQKTNAIQSNRTLLLTGNAAIDTKPQLEIFADDVKCTHGATIGQLDEAALFYLRARGISRDEAYNMLVQAFAGDVVDPLPLKDLQKDLTGLFLQKLRSI